MILSDTCIGCVRLYLLWVDHAVLTPVSLCDHTCPLVVTSCTSGQPQVTTQQAGHWGLTRVSPLNDVKAIRAYRGRPGSTQGEAKRTHPYSVNKNVLHQDYFFQKVVRKGWVWWGISARCQRTCCWLHKDLCITFLNLGFPAHTLTLTISSRSVDQTILFPFKPHVFGWMEKAKWPPHDKRYIKLLLCGVVHIVWCPSDNVYRLLALIFQYSFISGRNASLRRNTIKNLVVDLSKVS